MMSRTKIPPRAGTGGRSLSQDAVNALCAAGLTAWRRASGRTRVVHFRWHGRAYQARHTSFRLVVDDGRGQPLCWRWG
jgi:hypothetical protein